MLINYSPRRTHTLLGLFGVFINRRDYSLLREDMNRRFSELKADLSTKFGENDRRLGLIEADQKQFFKESGEIHGRLNELSAAKPQIQPLTAAACESLSQHPRIIRAASPRGARTAGS